MSAARLGGSSATGLVMSSKDILYFTIGGRGCYAIAAFSNGTVAWNKRLVGSVWDNYRVFPPALANDESAVYYSCLGALFALDPVSGTFIWNASSPSGMPVVASSGILIVAGNAFKPPSGNMSNVAAFDGSSGKFLWSGDVYNDDYLAACTLDETEKVCVTGTLRNGAGSAVYGLSIADGSLLWQQKYSYGAVYNPVRGYALIKNGVAYVPMDGFGFVGLDVVTGNKVYNGSRDYTSVTAPISLYLEAGSNDTLMMGYRSGFEYESEAFCAYDAGSYRSHDCKTLKISIQNTSYPFPVTSQPVGIATNSQNCIFNFASLDLNHFCAVTADNMVLVTIASLDSGWGQLRGYDISRGNELAWTSDSVQLCVASPPIVARDGSIFLLDKYGVLYTFRVVN